MHPRKARSPYGDETCDESARESASFGEGAKKERRKREENIARATSWDPFCARGDSVAGTWREFAPRFPRGLLRSSRKRCRCALFFATLIFRMYNGKRRSFFCRREAISWTTRYLVTVGDVSQRRPPIHGRNLRTFIRVEYQRRGTVTSRRVKIYDV